MGNYYDDEMSPEAELKYRENRALCPENNTYRDKDGKMRIDWTGEIGRMMFRLPPFDTEEAYLAGLEKWKNKGSL